MDKENQGDENRKAVNEIEGGLVQGMRGLTIHNPDDNLNVAAFQAFCEKRNNGQIDEDTIMTYMLRLVQVIKRIRFSSTVSVDRLHTIETLLAQRVRENMDDDEAWRNFVEWCRRNEHHDPNGVKQPTIINYLLKVAEDILRAVNINSKQLDGLMCTMRDFLQKQPRN